MDYGLKDKVVFITGAAQGIGLATASEFAKAGAITILSDISDASTQAQNLREQGLKAHFVKCDVSDRLSVDEAINYIVKEFKRLDIAFNNAGVQTPQTPMAQISEAEFDKTIAVDLKGVWNCMQSEINQMLKQGGGCIINNSSQGGFTAFSGQAAYIACKHAVIGLTRTAALDYAAKNIRINAVCPGVILTPMAADIIKRNPQMEEEFKKMIPQERLGKPEEIAHAVMWLGSEGASFVQGSALMVDGGFTIK